MAVNGGSTVDVFILKRENFAQIFVVYEGIQSSICRTELSDYK